MNRADLEWALKAVLPHAGSANQGLDHVGFDWRDGQLYVYATDRYTTAVARVNDGAEIHGGMSVKEATELMRWIRPLKVAERTQDVAYMLQPAELHIGYGEGDELESAVFELTEPKLSLQQILTTIDRLYRSYYGDLGELVVQTRLLEKFHKAARADFERIRILPCYVQDARGAAVVTIGTDFIGAIAGMSDDQLGAETVSSFLNIERKIAA